MLTSSSSYIIKARSITTLTDAASDLTNGGVAYGGDEDDDEDEEDKESLAPSLCCFIYFILRDLRYSTCWRLTFSSQTSCVSSGDEDAKSTGRGRCGVETPVHPSQQRSTKYGT